MNFRRILLLAVLLTLACAGGWCWSGLERQMEAEKAIDGGNVAPGGKFTPTAAPMMQGPSSEEALKTSAQAWIGEKGPDELQIGLVTLHKKRRMISFPAQVAEKERALEYALVHETGKTHEALLSTAAAVADVHLAALLLDAVGQSPQIEVTWRKHGGEARMPLNEMIGLKEGTLDAVWRYNGSEFIHSGFAASREGSLVALLNDPSALVNHPAAGALMNDDLFFAQRARLPPEGVQVTVHLRFAPRPGGSGQ
ncbi:MAG: hypothetical protein RIS79_3932 [Verrucomicrobiota bacterium]